VCHRSQTAMRRVQRPNELGAEQRQVRTGNRLTTRSGVARTKFISSGADNRAARLTIGYKPSGNSKAERFRARRPSSHRTRATHGREDAYKSTVAMLGELQLVEKKIDGGNPAVPGNDEISTSVCWRLTMAARYPLDPPAIAHFLRLGYWLISKVRVSNLTAPATRPISSRPR